MVAAQGGPLGRQATPSATTEEMVKKLYEDILGRTPSTEEVNAWMRWGRENPEQFATDKFKDVFAAAAQSELHSAELAKSGYAEPAAADTTEETAAYVEPAEVGEWRKIIESQLAEGEPELTPEMISQWAPMLEAASAPYEQSAVKGLREEANLLSPYSIGSGAQVKATSDMLTKFAANRMATALALGQADWSKKWDTYNTALTRKGELAGLASENEWKDVSRRWALEDAARTRGYETEDWNKNKEFYTSLAEMYQPKEKEWWEYILEPAATGLGTALGGPVGGAMGGGLSKWITGG